MWWIYIRGILAGLNVSSLLIDITHNKISYISLVQLIVILLFTIGVHRDIENLSA